ncbi:General transcription factor 3C polypeptide 5 [Aphelenchoides bicaudatus]|nr:General transcription factor 3C polypeptide 5 [Aphelenchoides bicaudatus]
MATVPTANSEFTLIEYPGIIKNLDNALDTLGGRDSITDALSGSKSLELRYYPGNLYQNGVVAEKKVIEAIEGGLVQLVFRVRRKKSDPSQCTTECLGMVKTVFSFKTLCDFQYLPLQVHPTATSPDKPIYEDLVPRLVPTNMESSFSWWTHREPNASRVPTFLPPFLFSRYTTGAQTKLLSQESERIVSSGTLVTPGKNMRSERKALTVTVQGADEFPTAPTEAAVKDVDSRIKREEPHRLITELFKERPMWSRIAITSRTGLEETTLKIMMAKYAFYILSGPWGRLWCRFGYDPRKHQDAKRYQTIMVSFRKHTQIPERQRLKYNQSERQSTSTGAFDYIYKPGMLPAVRQIWYSVCDIELPAAQKILRADFFGTLKDCDQTSGWLPPKVIEDIRTAIKDDVHRASQVVDETISTIGSPTRSEAYFYSDNEDCGDWN